jgi:hypothetical protein
MASRSFFAIPVKLNKATLLHYKGKINAIS